MKQMCVRVAVLLLVFLFAGEGLSQEGLKAGLRAPDFSLPTVTGEGDVTLKKYNGNSVVILHFWKSR